MTTPLGARLNLTSLKVTQQSLRNPDQVFEMVEFVRQGGVFSIEAIRDYTEMIPGPIPRDIQLIAIVMIPGDYGKATPPQYFIRNGHHRAVSIFLGGRGFLTPEEYVIENRTWSEFEDIHFLHTDGSWMGWVTPLDIRTECRLLEFGEYKHRVREIYEQDGPDTAVDFIRANKKLYCESRRIVIVPQLAEEIASLVGVKK